MVEPGAPARARGKAIWSSFNHSAKKEVGQTKPLHIQLAVEKGKIVSPRWLAKHLSLATPPEEKT